MIVSKQGTDGVRTRDLRFTRPTPYHLATAPDKCAYFWLPSIPFFPWILFFHGRDFKEKKKYGSGGIRTHASEETGALNQRLRPLGHTTITLTSWGSTSPVLGSSNFGPQCWPKVTKDAEISHYNEAKFSLYDAYVCQHVESLQSLHMYDK